MLSEVHTVSEVFVICESPIASVDYECRGRKEHRNYDLSSVGRFMFF